MAETILEFPDIRFYEVVVEFPRNETLPACDIVTQVLKDLIPTDEEAVSKEEVDEVKSKKQTTWTKQQMMTGSIFEGEANFLNMNGEARYIMPHGVLFEGMMKDGMFQGDGVLKYPTGARLYGTWHQGRLVEMKEYVYKDGLSRRLDDMDNFEYCDSRDRRFYWEILTGIRAGRKVQMSNDKAPQHIPGKYYDVLDGFLDLSLQWVLDRNTLKPIRHAKPEEIQIAIVECRKGWHEYTGFRPELYDHLLPGAKKMTTGKTGQFNIEKAYKAVPGFETQKKQLALERTMEILKYKINHDIATEEDEALYAAILEGEVTRSNLSSQLKIPATNIQDEGSQDIKSGEQDVPQRESSLHIASSSKVPDFAPSVQSWQYHENNIPLPGGSDVTLFLPAIPRPSIDTYYLNTSETSETTAPHEFHFTISAQDRAKGSLDQN